MTTLHDLIQIGALKSALQSISLDSYPGRVASQTEFKAMNEDEKRSFKGLVVIDGAQWYATVRGADPTLAKKIYSGDGDFMWEFGIGKLKNTFLLKSSMEKFVLSKRFQRNQILVQEQKLQKKTK